MMIKEIKLTNGVNQKLNYYQNDSDTSVKHNMNHVMIKMLGWRKSAPNFDGHPRKFFLSLVSRTKFSFERKELLERKK